MIEPLPEKENIVEKTLHYLKTSLALYELKAIQKAAIVSSGLVSFLFSFTLLSIAFLIANIGFAIWLGEKLGALYLGFLCSSAVYLVLALVLFVFRKSLIVKPFEKYFLNLFIPKSPSDEQ